MSGNEKIKLQGKEKSLIIKALPDLEIGYVIEAFGGRLDGARWRVSSENVDNGVFEIKEKTQDGNHPYNANNEYWREFKEGVYGRGAFELIKYLLDKKEDNDYVLNFIKENFLDENYNVKKDAFIGNEYMSFSKNVKSNDLEFKPPLEMPHLFPECVTYLTQKRGIPLEVVLRNKDNDEGKIYGSSMFDDTIVVFKGRFNGEFRSLYGTAKQACKGSNRDISGFEAVADERLLEYDEYGIKENTAYFAITEAAIDALSYNALFPNRFVVSSNGCGNFLLQYRKAVGYIDSNVGISIRCALDSDYDGDRSSQELFNAICLRMLIIKTHGKQLKEHFKHYITEENPDGWKKGIDEWFLKRDITFNIEDSPHLLFFNNPFYLEEYEKYEISKIKDDSNKLIKQKKYIGTSKPLIQFNLSKEVAEILNRPQKNVYTVKKDWFEGITSGILVRERPIGFNDWNEVLKAQGVSYHTNYEEFHKKLTELYQDQENNQKAIDEIVLNLKEHLPKINDEKSVVSVFRSRNLIENEENKEILRKYYSDKKAEPIEIKEQQEIINNEDLQQDESEPNMDLTRLRIIKSDSDYYKKYMEITEKRISLFKKHNENMIFLIEEEKNVKELLEGPESKKEIKNKLYQKEKVENEYKNQIQPEEKRRGAGMAFSGLLNHTNKNTTKNNENLNNIEKIIEEKEIKEKQEKSLIEQDVVLSSTTINHNENILNQEIPEDLLEYYRESMSYQEAQESYYANDYDDYYVIDSCQIFEEENNKKTINKPKL